MSGVWIPLSISCVVDIECVGVTRINYSGSLLYRSQAHFALGDYPSAKEAYEKLSVVEPHKRVHRQWVDMCRVRMGEELPRNQEQPAASSATYPHSTTSPASYGIVRSAPAAKIDDAEYSKYWWSTGIPGSHAEVGVQEKQQYRHQWFQMADKVEIAVLAKGLRSEQVHVAIQPESVSIEIPERDYALLLRLAGQIVPEKSKWTVLATKVEIVLCKAESGAWPDLGRVEGTSETAPHQPSVVPASGVASTLYPYAGYEPKPVECVISLRSMAKTYYILYRFAAV